MISILKGKLVKKELDCVIVDVGGVGYEVFIPLSTYSKLPEPGQEVTLEIKMHVSDSTIELYGFLTPIEKQIYSALIQVPGIGPKLARAILSGIEARELKVAILRNDLLRIKSIPRVGQKLAEKILIELKEKLKPLIEEGVDKDMESRTELRENLLKALQGLGYKRNEVYDIVNDVINKADKKLDIGALLKETLKKLQK